MTYQVSLYCKGNQAGYYIARLKNEFKGEILEIYFMPPTKREKNLGFGGSILVKGDWHKSPHRIRSYYNGLIREMDRLLGES